MKQTKAVGSLAWLAGMLAWMLLAAGVCLLGDCWGDIPDVLRENGDFYKSAAFQSGAAYTVSDLLTELYERNPDYYTVTDANGIELYTSGILSGTDGVVYYASYEEDPAAAAFTNLGDGLAALAFSDNARYINSYVFVLTLRYGELRLYRYGEEVTSKYSSYYLPMLSTLSREQHFRSDRLAVLLAVGHPGEDVPAVSTLYMGYNAWRDTRTACIAALACLIAAAVLFAGALAGRRPRRAFVEALLQVFGRVPLEAKLACILGILWCCALALIHGFSYTAEAALSCAALAAAACVLWVFLLDAITHRRTWLACSLTGAVTRAVLRVSRARASQTPLERRFLQRFWVFIAAEGLFGICAAFHILYLGNYSYRSRAGHLLGLLCCAVLMIAAVWLFARDYHRLLSGLASVRRMSESLRAGAFADVTCALPESHPLYPLADDLVHLRDGISDAVDARVKSERMKSELVTNVSHDLKTPLTSIISYSRLLSELSLPEPAAGYVRVLCEKSARLQKLTRDLFEVSRAQSGSLPVRLVRLDLTSHLEQTLAELSPRIEASGLAFRVRTPDAPVYIDCDGERLYRVLENLFANALAYAMPGTRVYVTLTDADPVTLSIRNVAAEEMTFSADEITERFVRGDASRTDGGTGLGLAIARSFTEAVGGTFAVDIDGDVFRVTLSFPKADPPEHPAVKSPENPAMAPSEPPAVTPSASPTAEIPENPPESGASPSLPGDTPVPDAVPDGEKSNLQENTSA